MKLYPFFFLISFVCYSQNKPPSYKEKDSVLYYIENAQGSQEFPYLKKAVFLAEKSKEDSLIRISYIKYATVGFFRGDSIQRKESLTNLKEFYSQKKDSFALAKIHHIKAMQFKRQVILDSSFYYYQESKNISLANKDSIEVGRRLLSMANMQNDEGDYIGGEITIIEGLKYLEPLKEYTYTPHSLVTLGNILTSLKRFEEARDYYKKALELYKKNKSKELKERERLNVINNLGYTYLAEDKPKEALKYLNKGLKKDSIETKFLWHYKRLLGNVGESKYMLDKKEEGLNDLKKLLEIRQKTNDFYGQSLSHNGFAYYYQLENNNLKALYHAKKGYDFAKQVNNNTTRLSALLKLGELTSGNASKQYYQEYVQLNDSLNNRERYYKNQFAKVRYETEKKDKINADLQRDNQLKEQEAENQRQQKTILGLSAIVLLVFITTYFRNRRKKLMYETQLQKASAREEERQQIAKSLHDEVAGDLRVLHQKLTQKNQEEAKNIETIKENVRNLSHQLSSVSFEEVSFKDQLINLISDVFTPNFRVSTEGIDIVSWKEINSTIKRTVYLCIRESLQNTLKHAEATKFVISFSKEKKDLIVRLKDNGKGIDEQKKQKGIGLKNLQERVEEIHGSFEIASSEEGTITNIRIPVNGR